MREPSAIGRILVLLCLAGLPAMLGAGCFPLSVEENETPRAAEPMLILADWIHDGRGGPPIEKGVVLLEEGRIAAIGAKGEVELPAVSRLFLASGATVIPGLVEPAGATLCEGSAGRALAGLRRSLAEGVTSIVEEAGPEPLARTLADWVAGRAGGGWPRVFVAAVGAARRDDACAARDIAGAAARLGERLASGGAPEAAVRESSLEPARARGLDAEIGSLEPGKLADLVVIEGRLDGRGAGPLPVAEVWVGGIVVGRLARAAPSADERASLGRSLLWTRLSKPSLWW